MNNSPKVAIMYLVWDQEPQQYLIDVLEAVSKQSYSFDSLELLIVYNSHRPDNPSAAPYIRAQVEIYKDRLPHTTILEQESNLGFSGGNNAGMQWAIDNNYDYVFLHNADAYMAEQCIEKMVEAMENDKSIGAAQSLVLLHPETTKINTSGNVLHYLMVGYCDDYKVEKSEVQFPAVKDVGYLSGAAVMMRTDLLREHGLWDEEYFLYHEDTDYSLRLKYLGYRTVMVRDSEFFHKYQFSKSIQKYYWIERNRYVLLYLFYKWPTLLLLFPMLLLFELGLIGFSLLGGWFPERVKVYKYCFKLSNWKSWRQKRQAIQRSRKISDRQMLKSAATGVHFQEASIANPVLRYIANPIMWVYHKVVLILVWW